MGEEDKEQTPEPVVERIDDSMLDRYVRVPQPDGTTVDMPLKEVLSRAGAVENVTAMERELKSRQQRFGAAAQLGVRIESLIRDGRHTEAQALVKELAGVTDDEPGSDEQEPLPPAVRRMIQSLEQKVETLSKKENAKDADAQIERELSKHKLFRDVPDARSRAKNEILAELLMNPDASIEGSVRKVHTEHARYLESLMNHRAEERRATERETRTVAGAGGTPEIVPPAERPTLASLKDKTKRAALRDSLIKAWNASTRAKDAPV